MKTQRQPRPTVKAILDEHVTLSVECLDRLYLNGHEWAKRQLEKEGIAFEAQATASGGVPIRPGSKPSVIHWNPSRCRPS